MVNSNPILLAPIDDTINTIEVFKASETAPSTPTGTTVPPSGWSLTPVEEDNSNVIQISYFYSGSWLQQNGGVYKSNTITHNEITKERISFFCSADNVRIAIVITAYSESNYDFVLVGKLDSTALTRNSNYTDRISGNGSSKTVWLSVPTRGEHFFEVAYAKDSSASATGDYGLVQITQAVRMTKKPIWVSTIRTINNAFQQPWSTPVRWTGIEGDSGKDGENAQYIFLRGTGYNRKSPRVLNVCSQENKSESTEQRGLEVALVDRFTMKVLDIEYFDTYGGNTEEGHTSDEDPQMAANARARFVTYLTNVTSDVIVCITSYDAVGWSHAMEAKLKEFGLTKLTGVTYHDSAEVSGERKPFAFLGIKGLKQGYAYVDQESDDANAPFAEVTAYIIAGSFMSMPESSRGKTGRFFYYAGVWANSSAASFAVSDAQAPYFSYTPSGGNVGYYVFNPEENGTYTMADMGTPDPNNDPNWEKMTDDFKYLITQAIFGQYAHLGSFIINGDWMLSQYGTINGVESTTFTSFDPDHPNDNTGTNFIPNFCVNGLTGETYQNNAYVKGKIQATDGEFNGTIKAEMIYSKCHVVNSVTKSYTIFESDQGAVANIFRFAPENGTLKVTLPNAGNYDSLELRFLCTVSNTDNIQIKPKTGDSIYFEDFRQGYGWHYTTTGIEVAYDCMVVIQCVSGSWYVIGGKVTTM